MKKFKVKVVKIYGGWKVDFGYDNQSFILLPLSPRDEFNAKAQAIWQAKMLRICLGKYQKDLTTDNEKRK